MVDFGVFFVSDFISPQKGTGYPPEIEHTLVFQNPPNTL